MNIRKSFKKQNRNLDKMFSMRFRFLATVIFAMVAITIFIGGISLYEVDNYVQPQAEDFVKVTCDNEGTQIDDSLRNMEKSVKIMESYVKRFDFILGVQAAAPYNCGMLSFGDTIHINFIRNIKEAELERHFFAVLQELGLSATVESNQNGR